MDTNKLEWIDAKKELPIIDDNHEEGEIPYLGIYCDYDDYQCAERRDGADLFRRFGDYPQRLQSG